MRYSLFLVLFLLECTPQKSNNSSASETLRLEDIQLQTLEGKTIDVEQFKGKYDTSKGSYYVNCASD